MKHLTFFLLVWLVSEANAQSTETAQQKQLAAQMAKYMDSAWDMPPEEGSGNLKILMEKDGQPLAGAVSIYGQYQLKASGRMTTMTSFNPNANGRYVLEEMEPGRYEISITSQGEGSDFSWSQEAVQITAGKATQITIDIP